MARWRMITIILVILALAIWAALVVFNVRPQFGHEVPAGVIPSPTLRLQAPLSGLPGWVASLELFVTLFLAGAGNLYVFPTRVGNMLRAAGSARRWISIGLLGLGFELLIVVFGVGAALARITFPLTLLSGLVLVVLSLWGYLVVSYAVGRFLLNKAGWGQVSPLAGLALGLLLLVPLMRIPLAGGIVLIIYMGLGLGLVIATRFGSNEPWSLKPLLEEELE